MLSLNESGLPFKFNVYSIDPTISFVMLLCVEEGHLNESIVVWVHCSTRVVESSSITSRGNTEWR